MPLISVTLPDSLCNSLLSLMERLVIAVERIAGPEIHVRTPIPATMADYALIEPDDALEMQQAEREFAERNMVVPGSPAFLAAVGEFEKQVAEAYGEEAINDLPWRSPARRGVPPL